MALVLATYNAVVDSSLDQLRRTSRQRLDFLTAVTRQTLQKYESMPYVLSQQGELIDLLEHPDEARRVQSVNDYLKRVREKTEPLAVYLLNSKGRAIASSNWSEPGTFVGQDYSFRPYFLQAMQRQAGRFYGVGTTTAEPGYFLSYPLFSRDADALGNQHGCAGADRRRRRQDQPGRPGTGVERRRRRGSRLRMPTASSF